MLTIDLQASLEKIGGTGKPQLLYLLVKIANPASLIQKRIPLNIALVLDRSTSMKGERLEQMKRAAILVIEKMVENDMLSIVTYSDRGEVVAPANRMVNKSSILGRVRGIVASGGTEIFQGLHAALKEMQKADLRAYLNHLILLTDGHTYGDEMECLTLAENAGRHNIGISAFGIGDEWNDVFLDKLVSASGGQSGYIETPDQIVKFLQKRIQTLGQVYANNLRLKIDLDSGIRIKDGLKLKPHAQPLKVEQGEAIMGDVETQHPLTAILEVTLPPQTAGTTFTLPISIQANIPAENKENHKIETNLEIPVIAGKSIITSNEAIIESTRVLNFYRMNEKAWEEVEAGQIDLATLRLRRLTTRLLESGFSQLAAQANFETERLERIGDLSEEGKKKLKFGTRALLTQALAEETG